MRNGTIWVASNHVGELTRLDGVGAEVNARVPVAPGGGRLSVSQAGADGYVINEGNGTTTRVDGATLQALPLTNLMGDSANAAEHNRLLVGGSTVYQLDPVGHVAEADARSLVRHGGPVAVAPGLKGTATGDGVVWLLDPRNGELQRRGGPTPTASRFRSRPTGATDLVAVARRPVLLDYRSGDATLVDPETGDSSATLAAELTEQDIAWGSDETQRLVIVRPRQGAVSVCRFGERACRAPVFLTSGAAALGPAIEVNDHVLVPDYGAGTVRIVDLAKAATVAQAQLFDPGQRPEHFDLLTRDGIAFYNDPDSERAGVIELDGTVRHIAKYNPAAPWPASASANSPTGKTTPSDSPKPKPSRSGGPTSRSPQNAPSGGPQGTDRPRRVSGGAPTTGVGPSPTTLRILRLDFSPSLPELGEPVTANAVTAGGTPDQWRWTVRRPDSTIVASGQSPQLTHVFDAVGTYQVSLTVSEGSISDTRTEPLTVAPVIPSPRCGDTITTSVRLRTDLTCPPDTGGFIIGADDITIDLNGHTVTGSRQGAGLQDGAGQGGETHPSHHNVTVRDGTLRNFVTGVQLNQSQVINLVNLRVLNEHSPFQVGAELIGTTGVTLQGGVVQTLSEMGTVIRASGVKDLLISGVSIRGTVVSGRGADGRVDLDGDLTIEDSSLVDVAISWRVSGTDEMVLERNQFTRSFLWAGQSQTPGPLRPTVRGNTFTGSWIGIRNPGLPHVGASAFTLAGELGEAEITGNTVTDANAAGMFIQASTATNVMISGNTLRNNGFRWDELRDTDGRPVNDGLHVTAPPGAGITIAGNHTSDNADYGIEVSSGAAIDGGGNVSSNDPKGCAGVSCR